ncbi:MAG: radical SAM protein [Vampirovibrionales bacterium]
MHIASAVIDSFQEYPPYHALVVFSRGCSLACGFCHNTTQLQAPSPHCDDLGLLQTWLPNMLTPMHEAVVFLGGEPTLHGEALMAALTYCKDLGLNTKVFTNAQHPVWVQQACQRGIIDAWSFDVKCVQDVAPILGTPNLEASRYLQRIEQCVYYAKAYEIPYELRTTLTPEVLPQQEAITAFCTSVLGQANIEQRYIAPAMALTR